MKYLIYSVVLMIMVGCHSATGQSQKAKESITKEFREYWYEGKAELTRYHLKQARYGEIHEGEAVLIFVTEDFLTDKQVKYEGGPRGGNVEPVLKLNFTKKFFTGLYPYSMMTSIFTPVNTNKKTLKVATSSQEWCGHTYTQLNLKADHYKGILHSYFMNEADQNFKVDADLLESELWNLIRLNPKKLPTGEIELLSGTFDLRLRHLDNRSTKAIASIQEVESEDFPGLSLKSYRVDYINIDRTLEIIFEESFPHQIVGWSETVKRGPNTLTTKAVKTHQIKEAYWTKNGVSDSVFRKELGMDMGNYR